MKNMVSKTMKYFIAIAMLVCMNIQAREATDWLVVGAGPAGITAVSVLIDNGVKPEQILWVDPSFDIGRLALYESVPANTTIASFVDFLERSATFQECACAELAYLRTFDPSLYPTLEAVVNPLRAITRYLKRKVNIYEGMLAALDQGHEYWYARMNNSDEIIAARHVVLATGSRPRSLAYEGCEEIDLDRALDPKKLETLVSKEDSVAVVGSAHSAMLVLKYLSEMSVKKIINLYNKDLLYATNMGDWTLHAHIGLKGATAQWAREVLENNPPKNLERIFSTPESLALVLPTCTKVVYAIGYEPNPLPEISGSAGITYNDINGCIDTRLYGIGIAFPERLVDPLGNVEHRVGVNSFMDYAQRVIPQWIVSDGCRRINGDKECGESKPAFVENY